MARPKKTKLAQVKRAPTKARPPRKLAKPQYRSFRLHKRIRPTQPKLSSFWRLFKQSASILKSHWRLFGTIMFIYTALMIVLVRGLGNGLQVSEIQKNVVQAFEGRWTGFITAGALFSALVGSSGGTTQNGVSVYQPLIMVAVALAMLWALRQSLAGHRRPAREAFYQGMYPLVPFLLVMMVIGLQLIPMAIGSWLYATVIQHAIAVTAIEKWLWGILFFLMSLLSLYMISSSIFALLIVSLPNMTPLKALKSARQLVLHRRWVVIRKLLLLPVALLLIAALIMLPLLLWLPVTAEWVYFLLTMAAWIFAITYLYSLYRELLNE